jgi:hypothetical protein
MFLIQIRIAFSYAGFFVPTPREACERDTVDDIGTFAYKNRPLFSALERRCTSPRIGGSRLLWMNTTAPALARAHLSEPKQQIISSNS